MEVSVGFKPTIERLQRPALLTWRRDHILLFTSNAAGSVLSEPGFAPVFPEADGRRLRRMASEVGFKPTTYRLEGGYCYSLSYSDLYLLPFFIRKRFYFCLFGWKIVSSTPFSNCIITYIKTFSN